MMTRKVICDSDDINFHMISEDFDKVSGKVKGSGNITTSTNTYKISIDYFDNTTPENSIKTNYNILTEKTEKTDLSVLLFCQVDVLHIQKDANSKPITYSLKGIFSLLKSYCISEGNSVVLNNTEFKKDDLEYFLNIIYKCIVFSQHQKATTLGVVDRFNMYSHFLFNIAKKVNLAVNDNSQNKANRISELNMPIDIVKDMFDMDKFERFINILVAVRFEYDRREKEFLEKINKFNLLKEEYKKAKKEQEQEPERNEPERNEPEPERNEPKPEHDLSQFIDKLTKGSTEFIEEIDKINNDFSKALAEEKKLDPDEFNKEQQSVLKLLLIQQKAEKDLAKAENDLAEAEQAADQAAEQAAQEQTAQDQAADLAAQELAALKQAELKQAEETLAKAKEQALRKSRDEEITKKLLMTVLIDMKEEQLRDELDKDLDEYFAARPVKVIEAVSQDYNYCKKQKYEQAILCYNGVYTRQLLDHINGIITLSDIDLSKTDMFVNLINSVFKDPNNQIQTLIQYSKFNEMKDYFDSIIKSYSKMKRYPPTNNSTVLERLINTQLTKFKEEKPNTNLIAQLKSATSNTILINKLEGATYETFLETIYDIFESIAKSIISEMKYDYSNRYINYNNYIRLKNNYLSTFRNDLIEHANCRSNLREMNMEYIDEPLVSELCGSFGNKVCLGKRKTQAGGSKKITLNGKKYKLHIIDGKKYITIDKKQILLSEAKKAAAAAAKA